VTFANIERVVGAMNFEAQWREYRSNITDEVLRQLGIFSDISPVDEQAVPAEDIEKLKQDLDLFLGEVMDNVTDDRLRAFVVKQIHTILQAIKEYPIRGAEAIRDGDAAVVATALSEHEVVQGTRMRRS
jgi:hypothetical protein